MTEKNPGMHMEWLVLHCGCGEAQSIGSHGCGKKRGDGVLTGSAKMHVKEGTGSRSDGELRLAQLHQITHPLFHSANIGDSGEHNSSTCDLNLDIQSIRHHDATSIGRK